MSSGYASEAYVRTLESLGQPCRLEHCSGWVLLRPVPGCDALDAMGCYPLFSCLRWAGLADDLAALRARGVVSLTLVAQPRAPIEQSGLLPLFDVARPFKRHYFADLRAGADEVASAHHRRNARRGLRNVSVERCERPLDWLEDWRRLYGALIRRHAIAGLRTFGRDAFAALLGLEDVVMLRAHVGGQTVGVQLFVRQGDVAYFHLSALSATGYALDAGHALSWSAIQRLRTDVNWIDWGGAAGLTPAPEDGLAYFKSGWSNHASDAWLLGAVLDRSRYEQCCADVPASDYFPAYRVGEFSEG